MCEAKLRELLTLSEQCLPTLDDNDSVTLQESVTNLQNRFRTVTAAAEQKKETLQHASETWLEYQVKKRKKKTKKKTLRPVFLFFCFNKINY